MQHKHNTKMQEAALLYAYGELPQEQEAVFLEHLKNCEQCQQLIKSTSLINAALPQLKAPEYLAIPILKEAPKKTSFSWNWLTNLSLNRRLLMPLGAAALIIITTLGTYEVADLYKQKELYSSLYAEQNIDNLYDSIYDLENDVYDIEDYIDSL